jgi:hypothetical protein
VGHELESVFSKVERLWAWLFRALSVHGPEQEIAEVTFDKRLIPGPSRDRQVHIRHTVFMLSGVNFKTTFPICRYAKVSTALHTDPLNYEYVEL